MASERFDPGEVTLLPENGEQPLLGPPSDLLRGSLHLALDASPDEAAKDHNLGLRLGLPAPIVSGSREQSEKEARLTSVLDTVKDATATQRFLMRRGEAVHDDVENLAFGEAWAKQWSDSAQTAGRLHRQETLAIKLASGFGGEKDLIEYRALKAEETPRMRAPKGAGWAERAGYFVATSPQAALESVVPYLVKGAAATGTGAAAGSVVPGLGTVAGGALGAFGYFAASMAAPLHVDLVEEGVDPAVAGVVASAAGGINAAIEMGGTLAQFGQLPGVRNLLRSEAMKAVRGSAWLQKIAASKSSALVQTAKVPLIEGFGEETPQSLVEDAARWVALTAEGKPADITYEREIDGEVVTLRGMEAALAKAMDAGIQGFQASLPLGALGGGATFIDNRVRAARAKRTDAAFKKLLKLADASKIRERTPDLYEEALLSQFEAHGGPEHVYIAAEPMAKLLHDASPDDLAELEDASPGITKEVTRAAAAGADVQLHAANYFARLAHTSIGQQLRGDVRFDPLDMTAREAEERAPEVERELTAAAEAAREVEDPYSNLKDRIADQLAETGIAPQQAQRIALEAAENLRTMAERTGKSFEEALGLFGDPQFVADFAEETKAPRFDRIAARKLVEEVRTGRKREQEAMARMPLLALLNRLGGVQTDSPLAGELRNMGVTAKTMPGLFRKKGMGALDTLVRSENPLLSALPASPGTDYADQQAVLDAIREEIAGNPVRTDEQSQAIAEAEMAREAMAAELDRLGIDLATATDEEIVAALENVPRETIPIEVVEALYHRPENQRLLFLDASREGNRETLAAQLRRAFRRRDRDALLARIAETRVAIRNPETGEMHAGPTMEQQERSIRMRGKLVIHGQLLNDVQDPDGNEWVSGYYDEGTRAFYDRDEFGAGLAMVEGADVYQSELFDLLSEAFSLPRLAVQNAIPEASEDLYHRPERVRPEWADEFEAAGHRIDPDGTVLLYHGTTAERAAQILKTGVLQSPESASEDYGVHASTAQEISDSYGDGTVVPVRFRAADLRLEDVFPSGRMDFAATTRAHKYRPVAVGEAALRRQLELPERGSIGPFDPSSGTLDLSRILIRFTENRNMATALHELGHLYWERLRVAAELPSASEQLRKDWKAAREFVGAAEGAALTRDQLELLARSFEAYRREGKAPSLRLREAFARFQAWLMQVYRTLRDLERDAGQRVRLTDDLRAVMDRMLASDDAIAEAERARGLSAGPRIALADLLTPAEREGYREKVEAAARTARERATRKAMAGVEEMVREGWDRAVEGIRERVAAEVAERPEIRARHWLVTGEWLGPEGTGPAIPHARLDREALLGRYGAARVKRMPTGSSGWVGKNGLHPDVAAEALGFADGDELVGALERLVGQGRDKIVERETAAQVAAELGTIDQAVAEAAATIVVESAEQDIALVEEERILQRKVDDRAGRRAVRRADPPGLMREIAEKTVAGTAVFDLAPHKYRAAAQRAGDEAVQAAMREDWAAALLAKRRQRLNVALEAAARRAQEKAGKNHDRLAWISDSKTARETLGKAGPTYTAQMEALLSRFGLTTRSKKAVEKSESLASWLAAQEAEGERVPVPEHIRNEAYQKNWKRMTVAELQDLRDSADAVYFLARKVVGYVKDGKLILLEADRAQLIAQAERIHGPPPPVARSIVYDEKARKKGIKAWAYGMDAALRKVSALVDYLDRGNTEGPFYQLVYLPIAEALGKSLDWKKTYSHGFHDLLVDLMGTERKQLAEYSQRRVIPELLIQDDHGRFVPGEFSRMNLLAMALNLGNESNATKLLDGYGWTRQQVESVIESHLTEKDLEFVQKTWSLIDTLWPEIEKQELRLTGVTPERVTAREVTLHTKDGKVVTLKGGYYPVVYDPKRADFAFKNASRGVFANVENHFMRAITGHGHTEARTSVTGPILLNLSVIPNHLDQVLHDLAFREVLMRVDTLLDNRTVKKAIANALGNDAYAELFLPWLQSIAKDRIADPVLMAPWERFLKKIRTRSTSALLFFRAKTILNQLSGHAPARAEMRAHFPPGWEKFYADALRRTMTHGRGGFVETREFVMAASSFMRHRVANLDRDMRDILRKIAATEEMGELQSKLADFNDWAIEKGAHAIAGTQLYGVDLPVWVAAFNAAQEMLGQTEKQAIQTADMIVRISQGSGESIELSEFQRGDEFRKMWVTFYSYLNSQYNALRRDLAQLTGKDISFAEFTHRWVLRFTIPALWTTAMGAIVAAATGDEPEEDWSDYGWWDWTAMALANAGFFDVAGGIPYLRDAAGWMKWGRVGDSVPVQRAARAFGDLLSPQDPAEAAFDAARFAGYATGLPTVWATDVAEHLVREK